MKRKFDSILMLTLLSFVLGACGGNSSSSSEITTTSGDSTSTTTTTSSDDDNNEGSILASELATILAGDVYTYEISNASGATYVGYDDREYALETINETWTTYDDETAYATGSVSRSYASSTGQEYSDTYQKIVTTETYTYTDSSVKVIYFVTDYEKDGAEYSTWTDSATRLPIVSSGSSDYDGSEYLLESSIAGQLSKQVSLIASNFINTMLSTAYGTEPYVNYVVDGSVTTYTLSNFIFSSGDLTYTYNFEVVINDLAIQSFESTLIQAEGSGDDTYAITLTDSYSVSYNTRTSFADSGILMDPNDYFLAEVSSVVAYYYNSGTKVYVDLNDLPLNRYIRFEASEYAPSKAVDIDLYPTYSSNSAFSIDGETIYVSGTGSASITIESQTGVSVTVSVMAGIPAITEITYNDTNSSIEKDTYLDGDDVITTRYIYVGQTYTSIYVFISPSGALYSDVAYTVSDETVLSVTSQTYSSGISLTLEVLANNDNKQVSITFYSISNPEVSTTITYNIKDALTDEERIQILMSTTYSWSSLYDSRASGTLVFTSESEGNITLYINNEVYQSTDFTYTLNGTSIVLSNYSNSEFQYQYDGGTITLDCQTINLTIGGYETSHYYYAVSD